MTDFLLLAFIFLIAGVFSVPIASRLGLGSVLGYLIAGIVISPVLVLLGVDVVSIQHFAEFGVVMMLFLVGLELEPKLLWAMRHRLLGLGGAQVFRPYPPIVADDILLAAQLGQKLDAMVLATEPGELWRFFRALHLYVETRAVEELLYRIHQYCRCIDGLILPAIGKTKRQFKSRTELFIGPAHHDLMGALYNIRSHVEHLHENRYLETFNRDVRLDLLKKEAIVEYIARTALTRIINQDVLWPHFGNTAALEKFWALLPDERRKTWGDPALLHGSDNSRKPPLPVIQAMRFV